MRHGRVVLAVCAGLALNAAWLVPGEGAPAAPAPHKRPTKILFGGEMPRVVRPRVGVDVLGARVRLHGVEYEEVTAWELAAWKAAGEPEDTDAWLAEYRGH